MVRPGPLLRVALDVSALMPRRVAGGVVTVLGSAVAVGAGPRAWVFEGGWCSVLHCRPTAPLVCVRSADTQADRSDDEVSYGGGSGDDEGACVAKCWRRQRVYGLLQCTLPPPPLTRAIGPVRCRAVVHPESLTVPSGRQSFSTPAIGVGQVRCCAAAWWRWRWGRERCPPRSVAPCLVRWVWCRVVRVQRFYGKRRMDAVVLARRQHVWSIKQKTVTIAGLLRRCRYVILDGTGGGSSVLGGVLDAVVLTL